MDSHFSLNTPGQYCVGVNYWASHAGTTMWEDWQPAVVEADFQQISKTGLQVVRIFPLWPVFQPLKRLYEGAGQSHEVRLLEEALPDDEAGQAGISLQAMEHFKTVVELASKYGLKVIVSLLTGWMSGRLFVPAALEGMNVLTDQEAIQWQVRFVSYFVKHFKSQPAILAWDLGNECNIMASVPSHQAAWLWTYTIANAIRKADSSRPILSGMHSLDEPDNQCKWRITDQAELTDVLTTHPYPFFSPHCDLDPINTFRSGLHATAQTLWYSDIGRKPCMVEEIGTLGPMFADDEIAADYIRMVLFSTWAHDCRGLLWWCAYDQKHLPQAPYDWQPIERELGLFRIDRTTKPVASELGRFAHFIDQLPLRSLPPRLTEAICILTRGQEQWGIAFASLMLAKQAGFDLSFQYADQPLRRSRFYIMPSVSGSAPFSRRFWLTLEERIRGGATLYFSHKDCIVSSFMDIFGLEIQHRQHRAKPVEMIMEGLPGKPILRLDAPIRLDLATADAEILGQESDHNLVFTCHPHGMGNVYFLGVPIEEYLIKNPGVFYQAALQPFYQIYQHIAQPFVNRRVVTKAHPLLGVTEHPLSESRRVIILINYSPEPIETPLQLMKGWKLAGLWYGTQPLKEGDYWRVNVQKNDAVVFVVATR